MQGTNCHQSPALHIAACINRPKDVQGCPAAPEEFSFTAFLALFLFLRFSLCVCVCVCVCVTRVLLSVRPTLPRGGGGSGRISGWVGVQPPPPPRVGWDFVGALGSIEPVPLLSFFCCRFHVTCLFMVCLHVIAYHVCMPHAHKGARMLCRLCWMRRGQR